MRKGSMLPLVIGMGALGSLMLFGGKKKGVVDVPPEGEEPGEPSPQAPIQMPHDFTIPQAVPASVPMPTAPPVPVPASVPVPQAIPVPAAAPTPVPIPVPAAAPTPVPQAIPVPAAAPTPVPQAIPVPAAAPTPVVVTPPALPVPPTSVEQPTAAPEDTISVARAMLADEAGPNWKKKYALLKPWQVARGMKGDGMFGPGSALRMASELGTVPIVRYWPKNSQKSKAVPAYRDGLMAQAATAEEPRRSQLIAATEREQGQAFGPVQAPIGVTIEL